MWLEQRTAEYRISDRRMSKDGFASLSLFYKIDRMPAFYIRYSLFDIRYLSAFGGLAFIKVSFPIRLVTRLIGSIPSAGVKAEPCLPSVLSCHSHAASVTKSEAWKAKKGTFKPSTNIPCPLAFSLCPLAFSLSSNQ